MNETKNDEGNKLFTSMLSALMMMRLNGPSSCEQFDSLHDDAFEICYNLCGRSLIKEINDDIEHFLKKTDELKCDESAKNLRGT